MIALDDLSLAVGGFRLDRISISAGKGEYLVLIGPSGAGKTVILETIAGIRIPDSGKVIINGRDMAGVLPEHRGVALVYQDYSLFPHMTVAENIAYGMRMHGTSPHRAEKVVAEMLDSFRVTGLKDRFPGSLSGGEQQRVALARALAIQPRILLLDEPFASMDPRTRDECIGVMQDLRDTRSVTIIQVSHSREEAYALADRIAVLIGGRIAQAGSTDAVFRRPVSEEVARFVGMENILAGKVISCGSGRSTVATGSGEILVNGSYPPGSAIMAGIPADCVRISGTGGRPDDPGMNILEGTVRRVTAGRDTVLLHLDGRVPLAATVLRTGDPAGVPVPGTPVLIMFRDTDVHVFLGD